jgi:hypothetical protein
MTSGIRLARSRGAAARPASRSAAGAATCPARRPEPSKHTPMRSIASNRASPFPGTRPWLSPARTLANITASEGTDPSEAMALVCRALHLADLPAPSRCLASWPLAPESSHGWQDGTSPESGPGRTITDRQDACRRRCTRAAVRGACGAVYDWPGARAYWRFACCGLAGDAWSCRRASAVAGPHPACRLAPVLVRGLQALRRVLACSLAAQP